MQKPALEQDSDLCSPRLTTISSLFLRGNHIFTAIWRYGFIPCNQTGSTSGRSALAKLHFSWCWHRASSNSSSSCFFAACSNTDLAELELWWERNTNSAISYLKAWAIFHGSCRRKVNIYCTQDVIISPSSCGCTRQWPPPTHGAHTHCG